MRTASVLDQFEALIGSELVQAYLAAHWRRRNRDRRADRVVKTICVGLSGAIVIGLGATGWALAASGLLFGSLLYDIWFSTKLRGPDLELVGWHRQLERLAGETTPLEGWDPLLVDLVRARSGTVPARNLNQRGDLAELVETWMGQTAQGSARRVIDGMADEWDGRLDDLVSVAHTIAGRSAEETAA